MVTPTGIIQTNKLPASGAGPNPDRLITGSEGIFGIVTEAWVRLQERPKYRANIIVKFKSFIQGAKAVREISQSGINPHTCRLIDPMEALYMGLGSDTERSVLLLGLESATIDNFDYPMQLLLNICKKHDGEWDPKANLKTKKGDAGEREGSAGQWRQNFMRAPYMRVSNSLEIQCKL
jgi:alkyldihydroxyacetonephosphate synthase